MPNSFNQRYPNERERQQKTLNTIRFASATDERMIIRVIQLVYFFWEGECSCNST